MIAGSLEIQLRADIARLQQDMNGARQVVTNTVSNIERAAAAAKAALAGIGIGAGLGELVRMSDEYKKYTAQLKLATDTTGQQARAMADVRRIAKDAQADLGSTGVLYARMSSATKELGVSQQRVADVTETVNLALKVSGASSEEARSATMQLSQAMASGALRGEEYNAVNEAAPRLMKALADGMGVPVGALKDMASHGKITSKVLTDVLPGALKTLREESQQVQTIGGSFTVLKNNVMEYVGATSEANGSVAVLTGGIGLLANNLTAVVGVMQTVAAVKMATWFKDAATGAYQSVAANRALVTSNLATAQAQANATGAALGLANARVTELRTAAAAAEGEVALALALNGVVPAQARAAVAAEAHAVSLAGLTAAQGAASVGGRVLSSALGLLGGPVGAVVTVLGLAATAWSVFGSSAADANAQAKDATETSTADMIAGLDKQIEKLKQRNELAKGGAVSVKNSTPEMDRLAEIASDIKDAGNRTGKYSGMDAAAQQGILMGLGTAYGVLAGKIEEANKQTEEWQRNQQKRTVGDWMVKYATNAEKLNAELKKAREELGGVVPPDLEKRIKEAFVTKDAAMDKEVNKYKELVTAIQTKTAENRAELAAEHNVTDSQKERIKLDKELATGKEKLSAAHIKHIRILLDEQAATERLLATQKLQKEVLAWIIQSTQARNDAKDTLEAEQSMYGKSKEALESYMIGVRAQLELDKKVAQMRRDGMDVTDEEIGQMTREKDKYVEVMQAVSAQRNALGKADQLRQENRRFAAESIVDAKQRAAAILAIDAEQYQESIRMAGEGTTARQKLEQEYATWYANQLAKPQLDAQRQFWESVDKTAHDTFVSILDGGKGLAQRLRDTLKNVFFDWLYQMTMKKWIINLQGSQSGFDLSSLAGLFGGSSGGSGGGSGASLLGGASSLISVGKAIYSGFSTGLMSSMGGMVTAFGEKVGSVAISQFGSGMSASSFYAGASGAAGSGASAAAYAIPIAGWIMAGMSAANGLMKQGWDPNNGSMSNVSQGSGIMVFNSLLKGIGLSNVGANLFSGAAPLARLVGRKNPEIEEQGIRGTVTAAGFAGDSYANILEKGGIFRSDKRYQISDGLDAAQDADFDSTIQAMIAAVKGFGGAMGLETSAIDGYSKAITLTLTTDAEKNKQAIAGMFSGIGDELSTLLVPSISAFIAQGETASTTLQRLAGDYQAVDLVLSSIGRTSQDAFGAVGLASIAAREQLIKAAGGVDALTSGTAYFAQNFLTQQEQMAPVIANVTQRMADMGYAGVKTDEQFKRLVLGLDLSTEAGAANYAELLKVAPQFKQMTEYTASLGEAAGVTADQLRQLNDDYRSQIAELERSLMSSAEARAADIKGLDASTLKLYERREALQAEVAAHEATQKAQADLQQQIDALLKARMSEAEIVALETAGMDGATRALYDRVKALKTEDAAALESQQRGAAAYEAGKALEEKRLADQQAIASRRAELENALYDMTHTEAEKLARTRERELAATEATLRPLQSQIYAMQDQASAAQAAADQLAAAAAKAQAIASENASIQRDMLSLQGDTAALRKLEVAALDPSNRALKEQYFALQDKMEADKQAAAMAQAMAEAQARAIEAQQRAVEEQQRAADAVKAAWQTTSDAIYSEIKRIRGDMDGGGGASLSRAQADFAIATAQARAGDQSAYKALPSLSQAMLALVEANAVTAAELRLAQAQTMSSLDETASLAGRKYGLPLPSFAIGANVLPYDMVAQVHAGERIIPAADNRELMNRLAAPAATGGTDNTLVAKLLEKVDRLTDEVIRLREKNSEENFAIARHTMNTADALDTFEQIGLPQERNI